MAAARWRCTPACFVEQQAADGGQPLIVSMFDKDNAYLQFKSRITCNILHLPDWSEEAHQALLPSHLCSAPECGPVS